MPVPASRLAILRLLRFKTFCMNLKVFTLLSHYSTPSYNNLRNNTFFLPSQNYCCCRVIQAGKFDTLRTLVSRPRAGARAAAGGAGAGAGAGGGVGAGAGA